MEPTVSAAFAAPVEQAKAYELVLRRIKDEILAGRIKRGDRLPTERQLSEMLQISRPSTREAVRVLEALQIIKSRRGTGPESGLIVTSNPGKALSELLRLHVALSGYQVADVLWVRMALEDAAIRQLTMARDEVDLAPLDALIEQIANPDLSPEEVNELDTQFHVEMAALTGNELLSDLMQAIRDGIQRTMLDAFGTVPDWPTYVAGLIAEHQALVAAIRSGDAGNAAALMRAHVESFYSFDTQSTADPEPTER